MWGPMVFSYEARFLNEYRNGGTFMCRRFFVRDFSHWPHCSTAGCYEKIVLEQEQL